MSSEIINRISSKELEYVREVLKTQFKTSSGATYMLKFEESFAKRYNSDFAISCVEVGP